MAAEKALNIVHIINYLLIETARVIHMDKRKSEKITESLMAIARIFRIMKRHGEASGVKMLPMEPGNLILALLVKGDMRMSELGQRLSRSKPNMTAIINGMIRENLVKREIDPDDRRAVRISITPIGKKRLMERKEAIRKSIAEYIGRLDEQDFDTFYSSLENVNRIAGKLEAL
jgi:DNA-binding MarR family transcriptional regulator